MSESRLVLVLILIGRKSGGSFLDDLGGVVSTILSAFRHSNENRSITRLKPNSRV